MLRFKTAPRDVAPTLANRRGAGADAYGSFYWIDDREQGILVKSAGTGQITPFWRTGEGLEPDPRVARGDDFHECAPQPPPPQQLRGLAVTTQGYLVVGVLAPAGLLIFDLHAGGPPRQVMFPPGFAPFDLAADAGGGVWILDRDLLDPSDNARLWLLDRRLAVVRLTSAPPVADLPLEFRPVDGGSPLDAPACRPVLGEIPTLGAALPLDEAIDPVAIEGLPDGSVLILDNGGVGSSQLWRYAPGQALRGPFELRGLLDLLDDSVSPAERAAFALRGHDFVRLPADEAPAGSGSGGCGTCSHATVAADPAAPDTQVAQVGHAWGRLLVISQDGNQAFAFDLVEAADGALDVTARPELWPMRLFGGRGLVAAAGRAYYDSRNDWVPLVQQPRLRYATELTLFTPLQPDPTQRELRHAFDGRDPGCVWHRLLLDGSIPPGAEVNVWSRAADDELALEGTAWQAEPPPYRRREGSERPFAHRDGGADRETWELLFQHARGRFLQLRLRLRGDGRSTPRLRALRAYYPRFSYLNQYLPAVYREDAQSASFLDRFLANVEGISTSIEDRIAAVQVLFDPRATPPEYLDWLAGWFGATLDPYWDEHRRRLFLLHAEELFRQRGTVPGLLRAIRLATDPCPDESIFEEHDDEALRRSPIRIVEQFRTRLAPGLVFGDPSGTEGPGLTTTVSDWTPEQGSEPLHRRWRDFLASQYPSIGALNARWGTNHADLEELTLSPVEPAAPAIAADWVRFLRAELGFTYAPVNGAAAPAYRDFLARRYGDVASLNRAYDLTTSGGYASFEQVTLPATLPTGGPRLRDWVQFASVLMPTVERAHRFTVLVATSVESDPADRGLLVDRVRRVVEQEKPAHTAFEVGEFWSAFRVGEARVGFDSIVDRGSRLRPVVLDASYLAGSYLEHAHPWNVAKRLVAGRDRVGEGRPL